MSNYPPPQGFPPQEYPPSGTPPQQPRSGCGGCLGKFLILLGVIFVLILAMCCGGVFYVRSYIASAITQKPAEVKAISDEIISMNVPEVLQPEAGGRFRAPIVDKPLGQGAFYADKNHKCVLVLGSFGEMFGPQLKDQILQALESGQAPNQAANKNQNREELKDVKTTKRERTILGQKAVFDISEGTGVQSGKKKIRVQGAFQGKTGPAVLILEAEEDTLSREKVDEMIKSIE